MRGSLAVFCKYGVVVNLEGAAGGMVPALLLPVLPVHTVAAVPGYLKKSRPSIGYVLPVETLLT